MLIGVSTSEEFGYVTPAKTLMDDIAERTRGTIFLA
jgi:hypothetical protein